MRTYRLYLHNEKGRIFSPAIIITAKDDEDAIAQAKAHRGRFDTELWEMSRLVVKFSRKDETLTSAADIAPVRSTDGLFQVEPTS
jgi:hypothetical protein